MLVIAPMFCDIDSNSTSPTFNFMRDFFSEFFNSIINLFNCNVVYYTYYWFIDRANLIFANF